LCHLRPEAAGDGHEIININPPGVQILADSLVFETGISGKRQFVSNHFPVGKFLPPFVGRGLKPSVLCHLRPEAAGDGHKIINPPGVQILADSLVFETGIAGKKQ
jgi:hypothetical protein